MAESFMFSYSNPYIAFAKVCLQFACVEDQLPNVSLPWIKTEDGT